MHLQLPAHPTPRRSASSSGCNQGPAPTFLTHPPQGHGRPAPGGEGTQTSLHSDPPPAPEVTEGAGSGTRSAEGSVHKFLAEGRQHPQPAEQTDCGAWPSPGPATPPPQARGTGDKAQKRRLLIQEGRVGGKDLNRGQASGACGRGPGGPPQGDDAHGVPSLFDPPPSAQPAGRGRS